MRTEFRLDHAPSAPSPGSEELAEGLMLVRASTLKVVRLQLAMERRDRRAALEAVDDLLSLDSRLQSYLAQMPAPAAQQGLWEELQGERSALNREKLILAAEVSSRLATRDWTNSGEHPVAPAEQLFSEDADGANVNDWSDADWVDDEPGTRRRWFWLAALACFCALIAAAYVLGFGEVVAAWLQSRGLVP